MENEVDRGGEDGRQGEPPYKGEGGGAAFLYGKYAPLAAIFLITATALLIYSNALHGPFLVDDEMYVKENRTIRSLWKFLDISGTRYVAFLSFALNYKLGGLDVFGYHLVNVAIHVVNGLLVWWLVVLTFRTPALSKAGEDRRLSYFIALGAALIFISHPVQTQAVTYITQRFASLATLFYLLSLVLYIKWRFSRRWRLYAVSLLSAVLAMKTKEIAFTLPVIICLYELTFFGLSFNGHEQRTRSRFPPLVPFLLTMAIIPLELFGPELGLWEGGYGVEGKYLRELQLKDLETVPPYTYLLTQLRVVVTYLRLLVLPVGQRMDYDYPISHSFFEPGVLLSFLFLFSLFGFAFYLFLRSRKTNNGHGLLISFGALWFFVTLSVESSVVPIKHVIFEHRLYLPLAGLSIGFTAVLFYLLGTAGRGRAAWALLLVIVAALSTAAHRRNEVWADELGFWTYEVGKSPGKSTAYNGLGVVYARTGRTDEAAELFGEAIRLNPKEVIAYNNLARIDMDMGSLDRALKSLEAALLARPDYVETYNNLGVVYYKQGRTGESIEAYREALKLDPALAEAHNNLGLAYERSGLKEEALGEYAEALRIRPAYPEARYNLGFVYYGQGRTDEAIEEYLAALELGHEEAELHNSLGLAYADKGLVDKAMEEFSAAIGLNPDHAEARNNLGTAYFTRGRIDEAVEEYLKALSLAPDHAEARYNLALAYREKGMKDEAIRELEKVLETSPDVGRGQELLDSLSGP
ncbi:MAG: tetratricopeptide repeat protein [Thermodesulfobacteriota bacterium]